MFAAPPIAAADEGSRSGCLNAEQSGASFRYLAHLSGRGKFPVASGVLLGGRYALDRVEPRSQSSVAGS